MSSQTDPATIPTPHLPAALKPRRRVQRRFGHPRTIAALMLREMGSRYGSNPGGYVWAVLEPLGMIIVLSMAFALMLRSPPLGNSFLLFYATGVLPYGLFGTISRVAMNALSFSRSLLKYPAVTWFDAVAARVILNVLTEMLVAYILLAGILTVTSARAILTYGPILESFAMAAFLGLGVGLINCVIQGFFPVWQTIWGVITRPLFLASGIIWLYDDLPPLPQKILWYNPLNHVTSTSRTGYYPTYEAQFVSPVFVWGIALGLTALGLLLMRRYHLQILGRKI
jgi:capsular polysaccharide transport system permease protein